LLNIIKKNWGKFLIVSSVILIGLALLLFFLLTQNGTYDLVTLTDRSTRCLDGSQGAYYISRDGDPEMFLLWFEKGGWCGGKD
jgi:hypothetical protein